MDKRTKDKHLRALRVGIKVLEGHRSAAGDMSIQEVITRMATALHVLGFDCLANESYYEGLKAGSAKCHG